MRRVHRHPINLEIARQGLPLRERLFRSALAGAESSSEQLSPLARSAVAYAATLTVVAPDSPQLGEALHLAAQATAAMCALASVDEGVLELPLAGRKVYLPATGPTSAAHVDGWRFGFYLACVCRDRTAADMLAAVPVDVLRRSSGRIDECQFLLPDALMGMWRGAPDTAERLRAALAATEVEQIRVGSVEAVRDGLVPEIELAQWWLLGESEPFAEALGDALERHREHWSQTSRRADPEGYLAMAPLALASLAHDAGWRIDVESEYLPPRLWRHGV